MSCVGYRNSPCHACLLFCMLVPAGRTPLIDANLRPLAVKFLFGFSFCFFEAFFLSPLKYVYWEIYIKQNANERSPIFTHGSHKHFVVTMCILTSLLSAG